MSIGLGLAVSHAPGLYATTDEQWDNMWHRMSVDHDIPQPAYVYEETGPKLKEMVGRIDIAHAALTKALDDYQPEILIIIGGDQTEAFDRSNVPQFMVYFGEEAWGIKPGGTMGGRPAPGEAFDKVELEVDVEFSRWILNKLVKQEGFDVAFSDQMQNMGARPGLPIRPGLPHAFVNPASVVLENTKPKVCLIYENTFDRPSLSGKRCYEFGQALARLVKNDPRRIAILGSGGLAHDPGGKRSGWLDVPLDKWFLEQISEGNGRATESMYTFDSDTMVSGTGENRAWITVAGALEEMGSHATVVDYVEGGKTVTGLGFAYWATQPVVAAR